MPARRSAAARQIRPPADVIVVGAGAFGGWTAYYLRQLGARVRLVDAYGPGNSRATSGDETRGVRSSYGDRGVHAELWTTWANRAIDRWTRVRRGMGPADESAAVLQHGRLHLPPGARDVHGQDAGALEDSSAFRFEVPKVEDVARDYPQFDLTNIAFALHDPRAGVVRARRACEVLAEAFRQSGGEVLMGHATLGDRAGERLQSIRTTGPAATLTSATFVFALGPWFPKAFPDLMAARIRTPLGHVHYFGTPPGDDRFTFPNIPSWNFPGVTGWAALPPDNRGFRVRLRGSAPTDPDTSDRAFDRSYDAIARTFLAERFPQLSKAPLLETRACHYEMSASGNFIIDRFPGFSNVWVAGGGTAEGFKFGPVVGEYIAKRVLGLEDDPEPREMRFACPAENLKWQDSCLPWLSARQRHRRARALRSRSRLERQRAAVRFRDLAAEHETDARSLRLGREERHEQIRRVRQARPLIFDVDRYAMAVLLPSHAHGAAGFERRVDGVAHQVDQQLLELIGIGLHGDRRAGLAPEWPCASRAARHARRAPTNRPRACSAAAIAPAPCMPT